MTASRAGHKRGQNYRDHDAPEASGRASTRLDQLDPWLELDAIWKPATPQSRVEQLLASWFGKHTQPRRAAVLQQQQDSMPSWYAKLPSLPLRRAAGEKEYLPLPTSSNASTPVIHLNDEEDPDGHALNALLRNAVSRGRRHPSRWAIPLAAASVCAVSGVILWRSLSSGSIGWGDLATPWSTSMAWNESAIRIEDYQDKQVTHWIVGHGKIQYDEAVSAVFDDSGARIGWTSEGDLLGVVPDFVAQNQSLIPSQPTSTLIREPSVVFPDPSLYKPLDLADLPSSKGRNWMTTLRPSRFLPDEGGCLDEWFSSGMFCKAATLFGAEEKLDVIYLWVNGSDPIWREEQRVTFEENPRAPVSPPRHYRERGELQYTMRSVVKAFKATDALRKVHVVTMDMALPLPIGNDSEAVVSSERSAEWRVAQIPQWLGAKGSQPKEPAGPELQWHSHREIFRLPASYISSSEDHDSKSKLMGESRWSDEESWRNIALPTFNSFAIETMLGWMDDLSDYAVQANDDMFFLSDLATSDFYSPLYGVVSRLDPGLLVRPVKSRPADSGEWGGLQHASWLLSQRFPDRPRNYIVHAPKVLSLPITQEAFSIWTDEYALAATRPLRESGAGDGDIENAFIVSHLRIERWREALLWTWIVAKIGGTGGTWNDAARDAIKVVFGEQEEVVTVQPNERRDHEEATIARQYQAAGWRAPMKTHIIHSGMDGHLIGAWNKPQTSCKMNVTICFGGEFLKGQDVSASSMFQRLAFEKHECGDCLIQALIGRSGEAGLSAFLPDKGSTFKPVIADTAQPVQPPHLPLTKTWQEADFSLVGNVRPGSDLLQDPLADGMVDLRTWTLKLLSRYLYVVGNTNIAFQPMRTPAQATQVVNGINADGGVAMACLNDDAPKYAADAVQDVMQKWMRERWTDKDKVWWEKDSD